MSSRRERSAEAAKRSCLDMGEPVRIADVAHRLAALSNRPVEVIFTGLRRGERLSEVLLGEREEDSRPVHPLISHVPVPPLLPEAAWELDGSAGTEAVIEAMRALCNEPALRSDG